MNRYSLAVCILCLAIFADTASGQSSGERKLAFDLVDSVSKYASSDPSKALEFATEARKSLEFLPAEKALPLLYWSARAYDYKGKNDSLLSHAQLLLSDKVNGQANYKKAFAALLKGRYQRRVGNYPASQENYEQARSLFQEQSDRWGLAQAYNSLGILNDLQGNYDAALDYYQQALRENQFLNESRGIASNYNNLGIIYKNKGDYTRALEYYALSLAEKERLGDQRSITSTLHNIGIVYEDMGEYDEALKFYNRSVAIKNEVGSEWSLALSYDRIGGIYKYKNSLDTALQYLTSAQEIRERVGDESGLAETLNSIAQVKALLGDVDEAIALHKRALQNQIRINDKPEVAETLLMLSQAYVMANRFDSALYFTDEALQQSTELGPSKVLRDVHVARANLFERKGDFARALEELKAAETLEDSLFTFQNYSVLAEISERYRTREQEQLISLLKQDQHIKNLWLWGLITGIFLLGIIFLLIFNRFKIKVRAHISLKRSHEELKATQEKLIQSEKMAALGHMASGVGHEINNPLAVVMSAVDLLKRMIAEEKEHGPEWRAQVNELLEGIDISSQRTKSIVASLMDFANQDHPDQAFVIDVSQELKNCLEDFKQAGDYEIHEHIKPNLKAQANPYKLRQAFRSLMHNAVAALNGNGQIAVHLKRDGKDIKVSFEDNGVGMTEEVRTRAFDPFFTTKEVGEGTGLGLFLVYGIVEELNGRVHLDSKPGKGTVIDLWLPRVK